MELTIEELRDYISSMPENTIINIEFRDDVFDYDIEKDEECEDSKNGNKWWY